MSRATVIARHGGEGRIRETFSYRKWVPAFAGTTR